MIKKFLHIISSAPIRSSFTSINEKKHFFTNISSNIAFIILLSGVNLWLTPFLISYLGIASFGVIGLANSIVSYISILTTALYSTVSRYLTIDLKRNDFNGANQTFNSALFGLVGAFIIFTPIIMLFSLNFSNVLNVPDGKEADAGWLFLFLAFSFFITAGGHIFSVSAFAESQFLLLNMTQLSGLVVRLSSVVFLYTLFPARLWYAGFGVMAAAIVTFFGQILLFLKITPHLEINIKFFDRSKLRSMVSMGGWVLVNMVGAILLGGFDLLIVNIFFGPSVTGGYASVVQFSLMLEYMVNSVGAVLRPVILRKFAENDIHGLLRIASQTVKLIGMILALPVGLLCGFSEPLLGLWLGPSYTYLNTLLIIIVCHLSITLSVRPLLDVQNALNKVRWPGIATLISGSLGMGMAILMGAWGGWGAEGVALAGAFAWTAKNVFFVTVYTECILGKLKWMLLRSLMPVVLATLFVTGLSYILAVVCLPQSWIGLTMCAAFVSVVFIALLWTIGFKREDRQLFKSLSPFKLSKGVVAS